MIDVQEAHRILFANVEPLATETVALGEALGRTLAAPVCSDVDQPPFDRAVMDGYAVRAADVAKVPVTLRVVGRVAAGAAPPGPLHPGEAMQINTGAPIPPAADAVVRVEHTAAGESDAEVCIREPVERGQFITPRATYGSAARTVVEAGALLTPLEIGAAASAGAARLTVYRRPTVAVLSTGDELIDIDRRPVGAQIRNSNQYLLQALVRQAGAEPIVLTAARDERDMLKARVTAGLNANVLCITGGVSMGTSDFVPEIIEACGATVRIRKMAIKPGRPTLFATTAEGTLIFALPGNPASAFVGFVLLVRPALAALQGRKGVVPRMVRARLRGSVPRTRDRRTYVPARARVTEDGEWEAEPLSWHGSGDSLGMARADALIMRPPQSAEASGGDAVFILLIDRT